eukprot:COSAG01_NODE_539_length_15749_cov_21.448307_10_plen_416_part_00
MAGEKGALDRRSEVGSSGWHWGSGVQHEQIHSVAELAAELESSAGLRGLEVIDPAEAGFAARAAAVFCRDGFVCCRDALPPAHLDALRARCALAMHDIVGADRWGGAKGAHRYMFGGSSASGSCMHFPEWAQLAALPAVDAILQEIWGSADFLCYGGGGDFCLPGSEYQPLHSDSSIASKTEYDGEGYMTDVLPLNADERPGHTYDRHVGFYDPSGRLTLRDVRPAPQIIVDFNTTPWGPLDGAIRFVPGTQHSHEPIPSLAEEPRWMRLSTVSPIPAGCAILRDIRCWHGGTPVLGSAPRAMPSCNYFAPFYLGGSIQKSMPRHVFESLCPRGQYLCRHLLPASAREEAELDFGWKKGGSRVVRHKMTLQKLQRARATIGGSMTGFWPPSPPPPQQGARGECGQQHQERSRSRL